MPKIVQSRAISIGNRKAVHVWLEEDGCGGIRFKTPIERGDFKDGHVVPRASAWRKKSQLVTEIMLSNEALRALQQLLNEVLA